MSNSELGQLIGVSHSMASRIRNGQRLPGVRVIRAIHRELDIPLQELMDAHRDGPVEFGRLVAKHLHVVA